MKFLFLVPIVLSGQAIVNRTNCPKNLQPGTIVVAQSVQTVSNVPIIVLQCYQLNPNQISIQDNHDGTVPVLSIVGAGSGSANPGGAVGQIQFNIDTFSLGGIDVNGDFTITAPGGLGTLNTVVTAGNCGDSSHFPNLTYDAKGRVTGCTPVSAIGNGSNSVTVQMDSSVVGTKPALNLQTSSFLTLSCSITDANTTSCQFTPDTSTLATIDRIQRGTQATVISASASGTTYTGCVDTNFVGYTIGMIFNWIPDINGTGGATTINVCSQGVKSLKLTDGTTNPSSSNIVSGRLYQIWYDGINFRILNPS